MSWQEDERPSERAMREMEAERARQAAELQAEADRQYAEKQAIREKMTALSEMKSALDRYYRVMRWATETYSRPMDYTPEKQEEELEIAAWEIQGRGETLRDLLPELFWPKGTPTRKGSGVYMKPDRLQALKLDLEATAESINDALTDLVEEEEEDDDE